MILSSVRPKSVGTLIYANRTLMDGVRVRVRAMILQTHDSVIPPQRDDHDLALTQAAFA